MAVHGTEQNECIRTDGLRDEFRSVENRMSEADHQDRNALDFTGERYLPEVGGVIELEHLHRYALAKFVVAGKSVLDIASGEGYGSFIMSEAAGSVVGVDIAPEAVSHASQRYQRDNLRFLQGSAAAIPLPDASVEVVVSFETIEHHEQHAEMFAEISRVLRPDGVLLMSSPDKQWYTDETGYQNPYHVKELYRDEFLDLLRGKFSNIKVYGQRVVYGSAILPETGAALIGSVDSHTPLAQPVPGVARPLYLIALASNGALPDMPAGLLEQPFYKSEPFCTLAMQYDERIAGMVEERQAAERHLEEVARERAGVVEEQQRRITELENDLESKRQALLWANSEISRMRARERSVPGRIAGLSIAAGHRIAGLPLVSPLVRQLSRVSNKLAVDRQYAALKDCPLFDAGWYLEKNADVRGAGLDPLRHYLAIGWREGRAASPEFDDEYYLARNPDVGMLGCAPLWHYWTYGRHEGRHPNPSLDVHWTPAAGKAGTAVVSLAAADELDFSVIIPTYNRKALLPGVLEAWKRVAQHTNFPYEIIFSDDGSEDGSVELLEQYKGLPIRVLRNQHGGASNARNAAIRVAKGKRLLIIGDDIFPDPMILNVHAELGKRLGPNVATLGIVDWHPELEVNHLMRHITEVGNEQFSFNRLKDGQCVDFRHFYTCNIAVDRDFLLGEKVIFDEAFHKYGFEDVELGYRLCMRGMRIYYTTAAKGDHFHPYRVDSFCRRQASAGEMAVVFRDMHAATSQILGIDSLQRAYGRSKASAAEPLELWESRRDWLVARCEFYENVISTLDGRPASFVTECLSELYSRLFKAMYEYGVLLAITRHPEVIAFTLARNFPGKWSELWTQMGRVERTTVEEARKALLESRFNISGTDDDTALDDLKLIRRLSVELGSQVPTHRGTLHMLSRALHYLRHDPRYLAARLTSLFTPQLPGQPVASPLERMRAEPLTLAVVVGPSIGNAAALQQRYQAVFASSVVFYRADEAGRASRVDGDIGEAGAGLTEDMVYCPASVAAALSPDHLYMASLALALNGLDVAVVSHDLKDNGSLRCASLQDQAVFSRTTFDAMQRAGGNLGRPLRGKVLRMMPDASVAGLRETQLADLLGTDIEFESSDQLIFHRGDAARRGQGFPALQLPSSDKPVIFVLPVFLAVGGVERNTVEVMRQLRDRYDFVVITMERLRLEQGSLAAQAGEVATHVLELSEACAHDQYLDVLKRWKAQLRPELVWICNGSPWLCDQLGALREVFFDVPIVDQKVYDAQIGWITRYGDAATRTLDRFIAINKKIHQRFVTDFRIDPASIDLIYSAIDASKFEQPDRMGERAEIRRTFGLPDAKRTFVFMGRLVPQKRPLEFLRLAEARLGMGELFVLVGDGELASAAEDYIRERGLTNVKRIPYVSNTADLFSVTDGLIVTSSYEGLPIAMLEAMAMSVPVLATDVGDIADVVADFDAGEVVSEANPATTMAGRMDGWLSRLAHYRASLTQKRGDMRQRFSSNSIAAQYEACWRAAANGYRGKARE